MEEKNYTLKVDTNIRGTGLKIPETVMENAIKEFIEKGNAYGTLESPVVSPDLNLSNAACTINYVQTTEDGNVAVDITPFNTFEGNVLQEILEKYQNNMVFEANGFYHDEQNHETGEHNPVIDVIWSLNAVFKK